RDRRNAVLRPEPAIRVRPALTCRSSPAPRQLPVWPDEVAGVAIGIALEIILMLGLGLPEFADGRDFGDHLAGPQMRCLDIGDNVFGDPLLLVSGVEDRRAIARSHVVALAIEGGG